jgi:hypothetical protein
VKDTAFGRVGTPCYRHPARYAPLSANGQPLGLAGYGRDDARARAGRHAYESSKLRVDTTDDFFAVGGVLMVAVGFAGGQVRLCLSALGY